MTPETIYSLPQQLRAGQNIFTATGGLHAAAVFDAQGQLLNLREDVGRHNALDTLIGAALLAVSVAQEFGITGIGFLRGERFNIYTGYERISTA